MHAPATVGRSDGRLKRLWLGWTRVTVNGKKKKDQQEITVNEGRDSFDGQVLEYEGFVYYMMNKPQESFQRLVLSTEQCYRTCWMMCSDQEVFPVGRLDIDAWPPCCDPADDSQLAQLLSPKRHVD